MHDPDDAPPYAYNIYDRCSAEGWAAYQNGQPLSDNPYKCQSFEWEAWRGGYER